MNEWSADQVSSLYIEAVVKFSATPIAERTQCRKISTIYVSGFWTLPMDRPIYFHLQYWRNASKKLANSNSCEFFHGPFEVPQQMKVYFYISFLMDVETNWYACSWFSFNIMLPKTFVLDAVDGHSLLSEEMARVLSIMLFSPMNNVFMGELSKAAGKDYMTRTYMWKVYWAVCHADLRTRICAIVGLRSDLRADMLVPFTVQ